MTTASAIAAPAAPDLRHFLSIDAIGREQFEEYLATAIYLKRRRSQGIVEHALHGKTLAKSMLEWCLPPVRFEEGSTASTATRWPWPMR